MQFQILYEVKPLNRYSFKDAMEKRFSPISIGDSCFLSSSCNLLFLLRTKLFDVNHSRHVCKCLKSFFASRLRMAGLLR